MNEKELERIYNEAYKAVYWTAFSLLKNEADAEDVVQDTFVTLIESYDTIQDKTKVLPWLKKIAANKSLNRLTRTKTDNVEDEFFEDVEAMPEDFLPDTIIESEEARKIVMDIINNSLSEDIRRTLILFYFDEMSTQEVAEALGVPQGTVSRRLNFARNKIKKEVEKYEEEKKTKLFSIMAMPFLSKLFIKEAEQVPFKVMPASLTTTLSASAQAALNGAGTKIAASAAKKGTGIMINKALIGGISGVVAVGATVGIIIGVVNKKPDTEPKFTEEVTIEETTTEYITASDDTVMTQTDMTTAATTDTTSQTDDTTKDQPQPYSIEGLSAEETAAKLVELSRLKTGDKISEFPDRFDVAPRSMDEDMNVYVFKHADETNCITSVAMRNVSNAADGTFVVEPNGIIIIKLSTDDVEFADELYDEIFNILSEHTKVDTISPIINDEREGDVWSSYVTYNVEVAPGEEYTTAVRVGDNTTFYRIVSCYITRTFIDGEYNLKIELPCI